MPNSFESRKSRFKLGLPSTVCAMDVQEKWLLIHVPTARPSALSHVLVAHSRPPTAGVP
jgi:hypothetical protein